MNTGCECSRHNSRANFIVIHIGPVQYIFYTELKIEIDPK